MDAKKKPDAKTFQEDPAFQADREILGAFIDARVAKLAEDAKKKREEEEKNNSPKDGGAFDFLDWF